MKKNILITFYSYFIFVFFAFSSSPDDSSSSAFSDLSTPNTTVCINMNSTTENTNKRMDIGNNASRQQPAISSLDLANTTTSVNIRSDLLIPNTTDCSNMDSTTENKKERVDIGNDESRQQPEEQNKNVKKNKFDDFIESQKYEEIVKFCFCIPITVVFLILAYVFNYSDLAQILFGGCVLQLLSSSPTILKLFSISCQTFIRTKINDFKNKFLS